jgi:prevent-host-death family protein
MVNGLHNIANIMKTIGASEAKNRFGEMLDLARREPVEIAKKGRGVVVVLSIEEFERFSELENELLALKAEKAQQEGFIGISESEALLSDILNAQG